MCGFRSLFEQSCVKNYYPENVNSYNHSINVYGLKYRECFPMRKGKVSIMEAKNLQFRNNEN